MNLTENEGYQLLVKALLTLETEQDCQNLLEDLMTRKEILDIAQRLKAAKMLKDGENYAVISRETGMSTATISRVNRCLEYGGGGYAMVLERLSKKDENK